MLKILQSFLQNPNNSAFYNQAPPPPPDPFGFGPPRPPQSFNSGPPIPPGSFNQKGVSASNLLPGVSKGMGNNFPLHGGSGLMGKLQSIQNVLKVTESAVPLVKQYGPIVKNIPSFLRLINEIGSSESDNKKEETDNNDNINNDNINTNKNENEETTSFSENKDSIHENNTPAPKLYI